MIMPTLVGFGTFAALREEQISEKISRRIVGRPRVCARRANAQDTLMIGKTSSAVAMKYARPTTPRRANAAKDTFQPVMPSFGLVRTQSPHSNQRPA
jgi:hypothetical protein